MDLNSTSYEIPQVCGIAQIEVAYNLQHHLFIFSLVFFHRYLMLPHVSSSCCLMSVMCRLCICTFAFLEVRRIGGWALILSVCKPLRTRTATCKNSLVPLI